MQTAETLGGARSTNHPIWESTREFARRWLTGRRGLIVIGLAVIAAGLVLGWSWLTAIGVAPIILSLAPCAAMCALGLCMMNKANCSSASQTNTTATTATETPALKQESEFAQPQPLRRRS